MGHTLTNAAIGHDTAWHLGQQYMPYLDPSSFQEQSRSVSSERTDFLRNLPQSVPHRHPWGHRMCSTWTLFPMDRVPELASNSPLHEGMRRPRGPTVGRHRWRQDLYGPRDVITVGPREDVIPDIQKLSRHLRLTYLHRSLMGTSKILPLSTSGTYRSSSTIASHSGTMPSPEEVLEGC